MFISIAKSNLLLALIHVARALITAVGFNVYSPVALCGFELPGGPRVE